MNEDLGKQEEKKSPKYTGWYVSLFRQFSVKRFDLFSYTIRGPENNDIISERPNI